MNRTAIAAIPLAALILAGCASTESTAQTAATTAAPASAVAVSTPSPAPSPDCATTFIAWRDGDGTSQLTAIGSDLSDLGTAATSLGADLESGTDASADEVGVQSAAASLQSDDDAAEVNLPPACVPGLRRAIGRALTDYSKAAADAQNAVSEIGSGDTAVADGDIIAAGAAEDAGTAEVGKATGDMTRFDDANS